MENLEDLNRAALIQLGIERPRKPPTYPTPTRRKRGRPRHIERLADQIQAIYRKYFNEVMELRNWSMYPESDPADFET